MRGPEVNEAERTPNVANLPLRGVSRGRRLTRVCETTWGVASAAARRRSRCSALRTASRHGAACGHLLTDMEFCGRDRANSSTCVRRAGVSQALPPRWTQAKANAANSSEGKDCATLSATMPGRFTKRVQHGGFDDSG